jgi:hypothetical protein
MLFLNMICLTVVSPSSTCSVPLIYELYLVMVLALAVPIIPMFISGDFNDQADNFMI